MRRVFERERFVKESLREKIRIGAVIVGTALSAITGVAISEALAEQYLTKEGIFAVTAAAEPDVEQVAELLPSEVSK